MNGSGGSVGIECSPTGPGFDSRRPFSASVSVTLTLDVGLFYLSVFPVQLVKSTPILLTFVSPLPLCASCANVLSLPLFSHTVGTKHLYEIFALLSSGTGQKPCMLRKQLQIIRDN